MQVNLRVILLILAIVCFTLSALGVTPWRGDRTSLLATGLALWALAILAG